MVDQTFLSLEAGTKRANEDIQRLKNQFQMMLADKKRDAATIETL